MPTSPLTGSPWATRSPIPARITRTTLRGVFVFSAAQSRKELRNPCEVISVCCNRRRSIRSAMFDSGGQIAIGGSDDTNIDPNRLFPTQTINQAIL